MATPLVRSSGAELVAAWLDTASSQATSAGSGRHPGGRLFRLCPGTSRTDGLPARPFTHQSRAGGTDLALDSFPQW